MTGWNRVHDDRCRAYAGDILDEALRRMLKSHPAAAWAARLDWRPKHVRVTRIRFGASPGPLSAPAERIVLWRRLFDALVDRPGRAACRERFAEHDTRLLTFDLSSHGELTLILLDANGPEEPEADLRSQIQAQVIEPMSHALAAGERDLPLTGAAGPVPPGTSPPESSPGPVADGDRHTSQHIAASSRLHTLSQTERKVLGHLTNRLTERQIAERMYRSPHTIHVHVKSIYRKLDVNSRAELVERVGDVEDLA